MFIDIEIRLESSININTCFSMILCKNKKQLVSMATLRDCEGNEHSHS